MDRLRRQLHWAIVIAVYGVFWVWYMPWGGPLTASEIDAFLESRQPDSAVRGELARSFFEADDSGPFVMVNLIDSKPGGETQTAKYMEYMWPALLSRACHPVFAGGIIGPVMDVWGIEGAEHWSGVVLMRYRSLRDLIEIAGNPAFSGSHEFKVLAMEKTIAVPAAGALNPGDLRIPVGLVLLLLGLAVAVFRR